MLVDQKGAPHFVNYGLDLTMHAGDRDTMEYERGRVVVGRGPRCAPVRLVRVLDDGALEAALEATRREERECAEADVVERLRDLLRRCPDTEVEGLRTALAAVEIKSEAAKGQAK